MRRRKKRVERELREEQVDAKALCESDESFRDWGAGLPQNVLAAVFQSLSQEREADLGCWKESPAAAAAGTDGM